MRDGSTPVVVRLKINRSREDLYKGWRDFTNLPRWMKHLKSVEVMGDRRSHWVASGPAGLDCGVGCGHYRRSSK